MHCNLFPGGKKWTCLGSTPLPRKRQIYRSINGNSKPTNPVREKPLLRVQGGKATAGPQSTGNRKGLSKWWLFCSIKEEILMYSCKIVLYYQTRARETAQIVNQNPQPLTNNIHCTVRQDGAGCYGEKN